MEQRISLITLGVTDLARSRHFYEHGLGWQPSSTSNAQVAFFQTGGMVLALYGKAAFAQDVHLSHAGTGFGGIALAYNVRQREEVDAVLAEAQADVSFIPLLHLDNPPCSPVLTAHGVLLALRLHTPDDSNLPL